MRRTGGQLKAQKGDFQKFSLLRKTHQIGRGRPPVRQKWFSFKSCVIWVHFVNKNLGIFKMDAEKRPGIFRALICAHDHMTTERRRTALAPIPGPCAHRSAPRKRASLCLRDGATNNTSEHMRHTDEHICLQTGAQIPNTHAGHTFAHNTCS